MSILSVQSHVAHGHVGNSAAVFVLQSMGHQVWPVHTVQLSNHPGYSHVGGGVTSSQQLTDIFSGIEKNGWYGDCKAILSGYLGSVENGHATLRAVANIKRCQPDALFVCDPVIGDTPEGIYVSEQLVAFYGDLALGVADVIMPNLFELGVLAGSTLSTIDEICIAARTLISKGPELVLVTSVTSSARTGSLGTVLVSAEQCWVIWTPQIEMNAKGAGDVFTALWTGHKLKGAHAEIAMQLAVSGVLELIEAARLDRVTELPLIDCIQIMVSPKVRFDLNLVE